MRVSRNGVMYRSVKPRHLCQTCNARTLTQIREYKIVDRKGLADTASPGWDAAFAKVGAAVCADPNSPCVRSPPVM